MLQEVTIRRYTIKVSILINNEFQINTIAFFDTGADQNCIREDLIPTKYYEKTIEGLKAANEDKLQIKYKLPNAIIQNNQVQIKQ